jgi:hypothetical protein
MRSARTTPSLRSRRSSSSPSATRHALLHPRTLPCSCFAHALWPDFCLALASSTGGLCAAGRRPFPREQAQQDYAGARDGNAIAPLPVLCARRRPRAGGPEPNVRVRVCMRTSPPCPPCMHAPPWIACMPSRSHS